MNVPKKAKNKVLKSVWDTYSSFANTLGDDILLGVEVTTSAHRHPPKPDSPPTAYLDEFDKLGPSKMPLLPLYHGGGPFAGGAEPFHHPVGRAGAYRQGECVPGGGMLGRILFENVYSSLKISPTVG